MRKLVRNSRVSLVTLFLLSWVFIATSIAGADEFGPRRRPGHRGRIRSVAEPAAIVLLASGLVSLGIYAKRKRGKK
jgi:hypothetical protein